MATKSEKKRQSGRKRRNSGLVLVLILLICVLGILIYENSDINLTSNKQNGQTISTGKPEAPDIDDGQEQAGVTDNSAPPTDGANVLPEYAPHSVSGTEPSKFLEGTGIQVNGSVTETYSPDEGDVIDFELPESYAKLEGILTFRGNNFRDSASYGYANLIGKKFGDFWTITTGALQAPNSQVWTGSGWTGQPLIVKWPKSTRQVMNMFDWAKEKEELIEVIYATMDGNIYFVELDSGSKTRETLILGYTFKGAGSLDPRGYPILYLGAGYNSYRGSSRAFVVSLIDGSIMYEFGNDDSFAFRQWPMFDASALVDAETDQLIYPGENGVLYMIKLNTAYDEAAGTLSVNPSKVVKWRYNGVRTGSKFWLGMEASPIIWRGHIIMPDNGGNLMCVNLNTLETVWVQDVLDDTNCTPVLELEDGHPYVYVSTSFHAGWRAGANETVAVPIWKIDAVTGEIVWQTDYECYTVTDVSGGVQGSLAIGKNSLSDLIFVPVARTPSIAAGKLVALNKNTGEEVWHVETQVYSWSSPAVIYNSDGSGYIIYCTSGGYMYLMDGLTGAKLDSIDLQGNIEASPAVYGSRVVVGTRRQLIYGVELK